MPTINSTERKVKFNSTILNSNQLDSHGPSDTVTSKRKIQGGKKENNSLPNLQTFLFLNTFRLVQMETWSIINSGGA